MINFSRSKFLRMMAVCLVVSLVLCEASNVSKAKPKKTQKILLNCKKKTMRVGSKFMLKVKKVTPKKASKKVTWKSSNKTIVSVNKNGVLKAKKVGKVNIVAHSKSNKKVSAKCVVTVIAKRVNKNNIPVLTPKPTVRPKVTQSPKNTITPKPVETPRPGNVNTPEPSPTIKPNQKRFCVKFVDFDGTVLLEKEVAEGESITPPVVPKRIGYIFKGWDKDYSNILSDLVVQALYDKDNTPSLIVEDVVVNKNDKKVMVPVYVNANPGILGMTLSLLYDDTNLSLKDAFNGEAVKDVLTLTKANVLQNNCNFTWDGQELKDDDIKDGQIIIFVFELADTIEPGDYGINIYYSDGDIVDKNLQSIKLELRSGMITVKQEE